MKRVLFAVVAAAATTVAMATPAAAQDANSGGWGCSVGGGFTERWAGTKFTRTAAQGTVIPTQGATGVAAWGSQSPSASGYHLRAGCDYHSGNWVFGAQLQHDNGVSGTNVVTAKPTWNIQASTISMESVTARAGYMVMPDLLAYVRGGAAVAFNEYNVTAIAGGQQQEYATTRNVGFVLGGGLEYSINRDWSVYGEYTSSIFGSYPAPFVQSAVVAGTPDYVRIRQSINELVLGVNYHF